MVVEWSRWCQCSPTEYVYRIGWTSMEHRGRTTMGTFKGLPHTPTSVNQTRTRPGMLYGHRNIAMLYGGPRLNLIYISALPHQGKYRGQQEGRGGRSIRILLVSWTFQVAAGDSTYLYDQWSYIKVTYVDIYDSTVTALPIILSATLNWSFHVGVRLRIFVRYRFINRHWYS